MISTVVYSPSSSPSKRATGFRRLRILIAEAKAKPDTMTFSSVGVGSTQRTWLANCFRPLAGIKMIHVPYKGGGGPINDLLGGQIDILIYTLTITAPQLAARQSILSLCREVDCFAALAMTGSAGKAPGTNKISPFGYVPRPRPNPRPRRR